MNNRKEIKLPSLAELDLPKKKKYIELTLAVIGDNISDLEEISANHDDFIDVEIDVLKSILNIIKEKVEEQI